MLGALLREPRPLRVRKLGDHPESIGFPPNHPPMSSFLGVPVQLGDRVLGNFYLTDKQGAEEFSQEDEDIIVLFASHAAIALENARRFTETSRRLDLTLLQVQRSEQRALFLAELSTLLPIGPIVDQIPWEAVANGAIKLLGDGAAIYLVDPHDTDIVQTRVIRHRDPARADADRRFIDESWDTIHRLVVDNGSSLFVAKVEIQPPSTAELDQGLMQREKLSAAMVVPIRAKDRVFGFFASLGSTPMTFSNDDLTFGVLIADRLGVALENAQLISQLKDAMRARTEFVSIATHELKTPTTVLKGYAQALLRRAVPLGDSDRRVLVAINDQANRLVDLVNRLLDVSRIQAGRLELRPEEFDLVALGGEVLERFALIAADGARLKLEAVEPGLAGCWDRSHIDQVLTNLVSNALKYSPQGGEVVVRVRREKGEVLVSVTDGGIGIPLEQQSRIFQPFQRGDNARKLKIEGAGLGLHIAREIVEQHGGRMWFESAVGKGSTFYFTLPGA